MGGRQSGADYVSVGVDRVLPVVGGDRQREPSQSGDTERKDTARASSNCLSDQPPAQIQGRRIDRYCTPGAHRTS